MTKELTLPKYLTPAQESFLNQKTPREFIKTRPGAGGGTFEYVEIGYVINMLNQLFGFDWDFIIESEQVGKKQVWVRGKLTVRVADKVITKSQYGGSDIKFSRTTGEPMDIANDLKSAASDCLKKCGSMIGIAGDVYWKGTEFPEYSSGMGQNSDERNAVDGEVIDLASDSQRKYFFVLCTKLGTDPEKEKEAIKERFKLSSFTMITKSQLSEVINELVPMVEGKGG